MACSEEGERVRLGSIYTGNKFRADFHRAMQVVNMVDTSVEAYDRLTNIFNEFITMQPYTKNWDGLGLEDQMKEKEKDALCGNKTASAAVSGNGLDGMKVPSKKRTARRPTNRWYRAPFEGTRK